MVDQEWCCWESGAECSPYTTHTSSMVSQGLSHCPHRAALRRPQQLSFSIQSGKSGKNSLAGYGGNYGELPGEWRQDGKRATWNPVLVTKPLSWEEQHIGSVHQKASWDPLRNVGPHFWTPWEVTRYTGSSPDDSIDSCVLSPGFFDGTLPEHQWDRWFTSCQLIKVYISACSSV